MRAIPVIALVGLLLLPGCTYFDETGSESETEEVLEPEVELRQGCTDPEAYNYNMNRSIDNEIETIFLMSSEKYHFISSRFIKEIHSLGGDISKSVPKPVLDFFSKI